MAPHSEAVNSAVNSGANAAPLSPENPPALGLVRHDAGTLPEPVRQALQVLGINLWATAQDVAQETQHLLEVQRDEAIQLVEAATFEADTLRNELHSVKTQLAESKSLLGVHKERIAAMEARLHEQELRVQERLAEVERLSAQNAELSRALVDAVSARAAASSAGDESSSPSSPSA